MPGLFSIHPELTWALHHAPTEIVEHTCRCGKKFVGPAREIYEKYKDHVIDRHADELEECGCCGCYHYPDFHGDCREDWERF